MTLLLKQVIPSMLHFDFRFLHVYIAITCRCSHTYVKILDVASYKFYHNISTSKVSVKQFCLFSVMIGKHTFILQATAWIGTLILIGMAIVHLVVVALYIRNCHQRRHQSSVPYNHMTSEDTDPEEFKPTAI